MGVGVRNHGANDCSISWSMMGQWLVEASGWSTVWKDIGVYRRRNRI